MEYFVSEGQFSENLIKATPPHNGADLAASFKVAKECMRKGDAYSSDCRLSISRLLTQQAKLILPPVVDNLSECLKKRNYPEGYEVDYMFPPVGCAKESVAIYVANDIYWACRRAAKGIDVTSHRANLASPSQKL